MSTIKIKAQRPWIGYPGSTVQQNYAEDLTHGFLLWDIQDRDSFDVRFVDLPNPCPFITIEWKGSVDATVSGALAHPRGARFRIRTKDTLTQKEVIQLTSRLRSEMMAAEVTFKNDQQIRRDLITTTGGATLAKEDLRNPEVLVRLLRDYHRDLKLDDVEWDAIREQVSVYLQSSLGNDEIIRNTKWSLRHLQFDNTFTYGSGNVINFEQLHGIVGIFGPNRAGKSSIVGTAMYALFNTTDRGNVKNLHVINVRHPHCYTKAIVNVSGVNYVIERQTVRYETKRAQVYAGTSLNVFRINEQGEAEDLGGEQRNDTEKVIRGLLGTAEDCLMTSVAAQDDVKMFINQGTTKRRKDLSRFLDLDIFDRMFEQAKVDVNLGKGSLRALPDKDYRTLIDDCAKKLAELRAQIETKDHQLNDANLRLNDLRRQLDVFKDFSPVTQSQVVQQRKWIETLQQTVSDLETELSDAQADRSDREEKLSKLDSVFRSNDLDELKKKLEVLINLESTYETLNLLHEREADSLKQKERALKILEEVPCGDTFPGCKFIKDAFKQREKVDPQRVRVTKAHGKLQKAGEQLEELKKEDLRGRIDKLEKLAARRVSLQGELSQLLVSIDRKERGLEPEQTKLVDAQKLLAGLEEALKNDENVEAVTIRNSLNEVQQLTKDLNADRLELAASVGRYTSDMVKLDSEKDRRAEVLHLMKVHELIAQAFSRKGVPSMIVSSQLPVINSEVAKILSGIVNFTVELEQDDDSDSMEIYIDYGDSRRIIELGSGMEKTIAAIAIRVALINVSSLPKTDMLIIDESFGPLDPASVEACNRLLISLKRYFRTIIVITHVDGVKDVADHVIEVMKNESDALVVFNESKPTDRVVNEG